MKRWEQEQDRRDYRAGMIASTIANVNRNKKQKAFQPDDFFSPRFKAPTRIMSVDESLNFVRMLNASLGGVDLTRVR